MKKIALFLLVIPLGFLLVFYFIPLVKILSIGLATPWQASSAIHVTRITKVLGFTLYQASISALLTLALGIPAGYLFYRYRFPLKKLIYLVTAIPFMLPTVVVASGFNGLAGPNGLVNLVYKILSAQPKPLIFFTGTLWAILAAHVFYNATIVIRMVRGSLEQLDPSLEQAARTLGASPFAAFLRVTVPRLLPAIVASGFLVFFFDFTSFGVVLLLGGPKFSTLEVEIFTQTMQFLNLPYAAVLSLVQLFFTVAFSMVYGRIIVAAGNQPETKMRWSMARLPKGWGEKLLVRCGAILLASFFVLPVMALPLRSITNIEALARGGQVTLANLFTISHYTGLFTNARGSYFYVPPIAAMKNSLLFGFGAITLSLLIGLPTAIFLARNRTAQKWIEPLFVLPLGTSSVTLGLGYILFFNRPWIFGENMLTSPWLLPFVHTTIALPFVIRSLLTALQAIPDNYYDAARVLGATASQIFAKIEWPLVRRAVISSAAFAFTISLGEFGATSLLARPEFPTMPTAIYRLISQPGAANYGQAMAMSTLLLVLCGLGIAIIERDPKAIA